MYNISVNNEEIICDNFCLVTNNSTLEITNVFIELGEGRVAFLFFPLIFNSHIFDLDYIKDKLLSKVTDYPIPLHNIKVDRINNNFNFESTLFEGKVDSGIFYYYTKKEGKLDTKIIGAETGTGLAYIYSLYRILRKKIDFSIATMSNSLG